jgi:preprotein translocase subunit SecG
MLTSFIAIAQIAVAVFLIVAVLLQERYTGGSGLWGGMAGGTGFYQVRRGLERVVFGLTIALAIAFIGLSLANLLV